MIRLTPTKLFLDGSDPQETAQATQLLREAGYAGLDGQTTNPSLVAKNPDIAARIARGQQLTGEELLAKYKEIVQTIAQSVPGDISIEVYADATTPAEAMVNQARQFATWTPAAVIKLPITVTGLQAAAMLKSELRLNLTLCFSQSQAAAVYAATRGARYPVYVSPFIGRLDDAGQNGLELIANILRMFRDSDQHVHVLTASVRSLHHIIVALELGTHALTLPFAKAFQPWAAQGFPLSSPSHEPPSPGTPIKYEELDLSAPWHSFNLGHTLSDAGVQKFADDWNSLLAS